MRWPCRFAIGDEFVNPEVDPRSQAPRQPRLQVFIPCALRLLRLELRPDELMGAVLNTPNDVPGGLTGQSCRIGQRRDVFTDVFRVGNILLELHPLRFSRE
jgi:hypothetical protein